MDEPQMDENMRQSLERVLRAYQTAHDNNFHYSVRSSDKVRGRSAAEIADVTFMVGCGGNNEELSLEELVALIEFIADQKEKLRTLPRAPGQQHRVSATIDLHHEP